MKKFIYTLMSGIHRWQARRELSFLEGKLRTPTSRFTIPFVFRGRGFFKSIEPRQNLSEIESLYKEVLKIAPERILEIGTAKGGTLYLWTRAAKPRATIVSMDLPDGEFGGAYPSCRLPFYKSFARDNQEMHLLLEDSHQPETFEKVADIFADKPIDFAFIDGDHSYEGVKADFYQYGPMVRPGGLVAFHDILPRDDLPDIEVHLFWNEIKKSYDSAEFVDSIETGRKRIGIGLIRVGDEPIRAKSETTMAANRASNERAFRF